jgi:hypothetical protein
VVVPITPYLAGQAFEPETIRDISAAFVAVCDALGLKAQDDPATRLVAEKIVEFAQRGVRDPDILRKRVLEEFRSKT